MAIKKGKINEYSIIKQITSFHIFDERVLFFPVSFRWEKPCEKVSKRPYQPHCIVNKVELGIALKPCPYMIPSYQNSDVLIFFLGRMANRPGLSKFPTKKWAAFHSYLEV